ncbi:cytochrome P450 [Dactylosporangium sp. CA-092794]|uniref:cytochrome P450 n=1 Tax=Dactylosporangium sp. CA-092794 TaxID=3239929 RepID=UPI003D8C3486
MTANLDQLERYEPNNPRLQDDPWPIYARYRQADPVHWGQAANPLLPGAWFVFGYDDCKQHLLNPDLHINPKSVGMQEEFPAAFKPAIEIFDQWLGATDEPEHAPIRRLLLKGFTNRSIQALAPRIGQLAGELLDEALEAGDDGFDFVAGLAFPLPIIVICELLGVPSADRKMFGRLSRDFMAAIADPADDEVARTGSRAALAMREYFQEQCADRRARPRDDFISLVVQAADSGTLQLSAAQLAAISMELVIGGHETTVNGLSGGMLGLLQQRDQYELLCGDPDGLVKPAVEEILRWTSPVKRPRNRWALAEMRIGDRQVRRGDAVYLMVASANRDEQHFPDPDRLDIRRAGPPHLAFGHGAHFCLGAPLARLEMQTAFSVVAKRLPNLELDPVGLRWRPNVVLAGPSQLSVRVS